MTATGKTGALAAGDRLIPGLLLALGVAAAALIVLHYDSAALHRALAAVGGVGLGAVAVMNFLAVLLCAAAWRCLLAGKLGLLAFVWFRYARNAAADLIGFIPAAGEVVALREMFLRGVEYHHAAASLIADLTVQLVAQLAFTIVGVALLVSISPAGPLTYLAFAGVALLFAFLIAFVALQRWGAGGGLASLGRRLIPGGRRSQPNRIAEFNTHLRDIYTDRRHIAWSMILHLAAWFTGVAEAGLALRLMEAWPGLAVVLVLESLVFGLRTAVFFVPGAWGVQESAYLLVGAVFGLAPETMLALILVKRARELVVGVPVLCLGQLVAALRRRG